MASTVIYDQIYEILTKVRELLRVNYDIGRGETTKKVCFRLKSATKVVRIDEDEWMEDVNTSHCEVSWDNNNETLRNLARFANNF